MLRGRITKVWDLDTAKAYIDKVHEKFAECRRQFGSVRYLLDSAAMPMQSQEVQAVMIDVSAFRAGDRYASVTDTALTRLGSKRLLAEMSLPCEWSVFDNMADAERWLVEDRD